MARSAPGASFEAPRKCAAPQADGFALAIDPLQYDEKSGR
jgi:hypothetical protein